MPQKRAAYKELRKSKKKHVINAGLLTETRNSVKKFNALLSDKKFDEAKASLKGASSALQKAAARGVIHKRNASRRISRLSKKLTQSLAAKK